jgi:hypothetical protein
MQIKDFSKKTQSTEGEIEAQSKQNYKVTQ